MNKKFKIHTLGCRTNKYESEVYHDQLVDMGHDLSENDIDIHIINTCAVTKSAENASKAKLSELLSEDYHSKIFITGCSSHVFKGSESERVIIVPNLEKEKLASVIFPNKVIPPFKVNNFLNQTRAFIKIQDGCNNFCSYCIIPFVRGRSRSRPLSDIIEEVKGLTRKGFKEVVITGINIGDYKHEGKNLADLVRALDKIDGLKRIRLSSIDPDKVDNDLLDIILNGDNTCSSLHLSLQSGSEKILKKMNRNYVLDDFLSLANKIKKESSDFTFTTDIIVGFPGETEKDFADSLAVIENVGFAKVHMFPFSVREGTLAEKFEDKIPQDIIKVRKKKMIEIAEKKAFDLRDGYIGRTMQVLLEKEDKKGEYFLGRLDNFINVKVRCDTKCSKNILSNNMLLDVLIVGNSEEGLIGELT